MSGRPRYTPWQPARLGDLAVRSTRLFAIFALVGVVAAGPSPRSAGAATPITSAVLPNGVTIVARERPGSQVLAVDVAVRAGARYETDETGSAARFLESALLLGTERWPTRDALVRSIAGRGGQLSVSAGREIVEVSTAVSLPDAELALEVLRDVLLHSHFDPEAVERERQVILQQVQEREDESDDRAADVLFQTVFAGHPLANLPYGTYSGVEALTVDRLRGYWRERLVGPNVLIAVVSGLPHDELVAMVGRALEGVPAGPVPSLNYAEIPAAAARTVELPLGTDQSHIFIGVPVPGVATEDRAPLRVLNAVLGRSSGRLFGEIRDRRGLAYSAYSAVSQFVDGGIFYVYAGTQPSTADTVLELLKSELQRIREEPVDPIELQNAIGGEVGARTIGVETSSNEALYMARDTVFGVPPREVQAAQARAVTAADVQRVARRYLDPDRFSVVVTGWGRAEGPERAP
jgi:predicted Zn-dependent peptidase